MALHEHGPLTFRQTQSPVNQVDRDAALRGQFPGPILPASQFSIQGGRAQLNSREGAMLDSVVRRLKRQNGPSAAFAIGRAFNR